MIEEKDTVQLLFILSTNRGILNESLGEPTTHWLFKPMPDCNRRKDRDPNDRDVIDVGGWRMLPEEPEPLVSWPDEVPLITGELGCQLDCLNLCEGGKFDKSI